MGFDERALSNKAKEIYDKLRNVMDPEIGISITEMRLIDEIKVEGKKASITYHLSAPFCPPQFALYIGKEIKQKTQSIKGIEDVEVTLKDHMRADQINKSLREGQAS